MLQKKLVIAMCAAFALSACGGSDQDDQSRIVLNPPEDLNAGDEDTNGNGDGEENGNGDGEENGNGDGDGEENGNGDGDANGNGDGDGDGEQCTPQEAVGYHFNFETQEDVDAWFVNGDGQNIRLDFDQTNSAMTITPLQWVEDEDSFRRQTRIELEQAEDLTGASVTVEMEIHEDYINDGGLAVQLVAQGAGYADNYLGTGDLVAGANTITWTPGASEGTTHFGIQLSQIPNDQTILQPFSVHSVSIVLEEAVICDDETNGGEEDSNVYQANMTEGWRVDADAVPFDYVDNGVEYSPTAEDQQLVYDVDGPIDLTGATFVLSYTIDQELFESGANIQPFAQAVSGTWKDCWVNNGDHVAGEVKEIACVFDAFDVDTDVKIGIQPKGSDVSGTLTIHSLEIQFAEE